MSVEARNEDECVVCSRVQPPQQCQKLHSDFEWIHYDHEVHQWRGVKISKVKAASKTRQLLRAGINTVRLHKRAHAEEDGKVFRIIVLAHNAHVQGSPGSSPPCTSQKTACCTSKAARQSSRNTLVGGTITATSPEGEILYESM